MINPDLEKRYADCVELTDAWKQYFEFYNKAVKEEGELSPELETKFMECKGTIAMLHDSLMDSLKQDRDIGQNMLAIVNRSITLKHVRNLGQADKKKIEIEWHECYLQLSETVSMLAEQREKLAKVSKFQEKMGKLKDSAHTSTHNFFTSVWFRLIIIVAVIVALVVFVPWNDLRDYGTAGRWYQAVLDFGRDELKIWDAPYGTMERFRLRYMDREAPHGVSISQDNLLTEPRFAAQLQWLHLRVPDQPASDYIQNREEFLTRNYNFTVEGRQTSVHAGAYYWYSRNQAQTVESEYRTALSQDPPHPGTRQVTIARVHNVLIVLMGGTPDDRERIRRDVFGN